MNEHIPKSGIYDLAQTPSGEIIKDVSAKDLGTMLCDPNFAVS